MRIWMIFVVALLAIGLLFGCGKKKQEAQKAQPTTEQVQKTAKVVCPVSGTEVDTSKVKITAQYNGKTYYFCSEEDKAKFEANPEKYVTAAPEKGEKEKEGQGMEKKEEGKEKQ